MDEALDLFARTLAMRGVSPLTARAYLADLRQFLDFVRHAGKQHLAEIDHLYPELRIDFLTVRGEFGPDLIDALVDRLDVPRNYMFIGTPGDRFPHRLDTLGGVRVIL